LDNSIFRIGPDITKEHIPTALTDLRLSGLYCLDKGVKEAALKFGAATEQDSKNMEEI
jgi:hypothetical protein